MRETRAAHRYARALLEAAEERDLLDQVREDMGRLSDLIEGSADLRAFLVDPLIHPKVKREAFERIGRGKLCTLVLNFLLLLTQRRRERLLPEILREFEKMLDEHEGIVVAEVRMARPFTPDQEERLMQKLSAYSGRKVRLEVEIDQSLQGGFIAHLGDTVFDGSLQTQLERLREHMVGGWG